MLPWNHFVELPVPPLPDQNHGTSTHRFCRGAEKFSRPAGSLAIFSSLVSFRFIMTSSLVPSNRGRLIFDVMLP